MGPDRFARFVIRSIYVHKDLDDVQTSVGAGTVEWVDSRFVEVVHIRAVLYQELSDGR